MAYTETTEIHGIRIACLNVRGLIASEDKRKRLHQWLIKNQIDIALLQEVCVHHEHTPVPFPITDFPGYLDDRKNKFLESKIIWKKAFNLHSEVECSSGYKLRNHVYLSVVLDF